MSEGDHIIGEEEPLARSVEPNTGQLATAAEIQHSPKFEPQDQGDLASSDHRRQQPTHVRSAMNEKFVSQMRLTFLVQLATFVGIISYLNGVL